MLSGDLYVFLTCTWTHYKSANIEYRRTILLYKWKHTPKQETDLVEDKKITTKINKNTNGKEKKER